MTNTKASSGGGLLNVHAGIDTRNYFFTNNYASEGGAVYNMVTKSRNHVSADGTVIGAAPTFERCTFHDNHATGRGDSVNSDFMQLKKIDC